MCGIVGAVGLPGALAPEREARILGSLAHRGPDASGSLFAGGVWLGFRRLAILDLRTDAEQPMVDDTTLVSIVFNGEIYNYVELRTSLEARGHRFGTTGDTEVLLRGYLEWGEEVFSLCEGMWATAILDPRRRGLLLARDRFGEKPLHVARDSAGVWWFASEPEALRVAGAGTGLLNRERALAFLLLGDVEDPAGSYFGGVTQLPPAHLATLDTCGLHSVRPWWSLQELVERNWDGSPPTSEETLDALDRSVRLRLRSDVTVGTSLSGGTDSGLVISSLRAVDPDRELHTFTASFPGQSVDEWNRAAVMGERCRAVMHRVEPTPEGFLRDLDRLLVRQGGPIESPTVYAQYCVMEAARREGVVVLLDGQGADETWGGYPKHVWFGVVDSLLRGRGSSALRLVRAWRALGGLPSVDGRQVVSLAVGERLRALLRASLARASSRHLGPALRGVTMDDPQGGVLTGSLLQRAAQSDAERVILPRLLRYADRNSMAWSLEVRLPFLDPDVIALGYRAGWSAGFQRGWTKAALRTAAAARVPSETVWRREKSAYEVPDALWLARPGIHAALRDAATGLQQRGLLSGDHLAQSKPWRVLSMARFLDVSGLSV